MKNIIKLEELGVFALSVFLLFKLAHPLSWWMYALLFFAPDIGMLGYLINTRVGAVTYNYFHHKAVASFLVILGVVVANHFLIMSGLLMFAHSSFDRVLGFGLKYPDSFKHTSVGTI